MYSSLIAAGPPTSAFHAGSDSTGIPARRPVCYRATWQPARLHPHQHGTTNDELTVSDQLHTVTSRLQVARKNEASASGAAVIKSRDVRPPVAPASCIGR